MAEKIPVAFEKTNLINDAVSLFIDNSVYEGWEDVKITRELNAAASDIELQVVDKWREGEQPWRIVPGQAMKVFVGQQKVLTGFTEKMSVAVSKDSRTVNIFGRSKTCDIVDCCITTENAFLNLNLSELSNKLCLPFGVKTSFLGAVGDPFDQIVIQPGETVFAVLERHTKQRKLLVYCDYDGKLIFAPCGIRNARTELKQGVNVLSGSASFDDTNRFSEYTVKGQNIGFMGGDSVMGKSTDAGIKRYRPYVIMADQAADETKSQARANYEAALRAGQSLQVQVQVQGWFQEDGSLWDINEIVKTDIGFLGVRRNLLVKKVEFNKGNGGTTTTLSLVRPDAYLFEPIKEDAKLGWTTAALKK